MMDRIQKEQEQTPSRGIMHQMRNGSYPRKDEL